jgi:hypothetical protein
MVLSAVVLTLAGFAAAHFQSSLPIAVGVLVALALWFVRLHMQSLCGLTALQVARSRKAEGLGFLLLILFSALH